MAEDSRLLLLARDADEVPLVSALVQSSAVRASDVGYDKTTRRLVLLINRDRWETRDRTRVRSALRLDSVVAVRRKAWPSADTVLELLALTYAADVLTLSFAGGTTLRVTVECPDLVLEDMSAPWPASREPQHD